VRLSIDTNVLVYLIDRDAGDRHQRAVEILDRAAIARLHSDAPGAR
jgi:predicted nucleic acid-binding protein